MSNKEWVPTKWYKCKSGRHEWPATDPTSLVRCCNGWIPVWKCLGEAGGAWHYELSLMTQEEVAEIDSFSSSPDRSHLLKPT